MEPPRRLLKTKRTTDPGQSVIIGFILVFATLVITWSLYQGFIVPQQNREIEFDHSQRVQGDVLNLRDALIRTGTTGVQQTTTITAGADYPRRSLTTNFAQSGGRIETRDPAPNGPKTIRIENVSALDVETADYLSESVTVSTKSLVYSPTFTRYNKAPATIIAGGAGAVINDFGQTNLTIGNQILITGRTITIVAIEGNLSTSVTGEGASLSVEALPLSVATNRVTIENNESDRRISIMVPTRIDNVSAWNESTLAAKFGTEGNVHDVKTVDQNRIAIVLDKGQYTLRMMKVGVGTGITGPGPTYLTDIETPGDSVLEGSSQKITLEVRDAFNNPVDGVQVNATISSTSTTNGTLGVVGESDTTDIQDDRISANTSNGQVTFNYTAPEVGADSDLNLNFTLGDTPFAAADRVWVNTTVIDTDASGTAGTNPAQGTVLVEDVELVSGGDDEYAVTFLNDAGEDRTITNIRASFYSDGNVDNVTVTNDSTNLLVDRSELPIPSTFSEGDIETSDPDGISLSADERYTVEFNALNNVGGGGAANDMSGDFMILSIKLESGTTNSYFIVFP